MKQDDDAREESWWQDVEARGLLSRAAIMYTARVAALICAMVLYGKQPLVAVAIALTVLSAWWPLPAQSKR